MPAPKLDTTSLALLAGVPADHGGKPHYVVRTDTGVTLAFIPTDAPDAVRIAVLVEHALAHPLDEDPIPDVLETVDTALKDAEAVLRHLAERSTEPHHRGPVRSRGHELLRPREARRRSRP